MKKSNLVHTSAPKGPEYADDTSTPSNTAVSTETTSSSSISEQTKGVNIRHGFPRLICPLVSAAGSIRNPAQKDPDSNTRSASVSSGGKHLGGAPSRANDCSTSNELCGTASAASFCSPIVHVRIRPPLQYFGEKTEKRQVWVLDDQNMVVQTVSRSRRDQDMRTMRVLPLELNNQKDTPKVPKEKPKERKVHSARTKNTNVTKDRKNESDATKFRKSMSDCTLSVDISSAVSSISAASLHSPVSSCEEGLPVRGGGDGEFAKNLLAEESNPSSFKPYSIPPTQNILQLSDLEKLKNGANVVRSSAKGQTSQKKNPQTARGVATPRTERNKQRTSSSKTYGKKEITSSENKSGIQGTAGDTVKTPSTVPSPRSESIPGIEKHYSFPRIHCEEATQEEVFEESVLDFIGDALFGQNIAILSYGPTGSGKTYTMMGDQHTILQNSAAKGSDRKKNSMNRSNKGSPKARFPSASTGSGKATGTPLTPRMNSSKPRSPAQAKKESIAFDGNNSTNGQERAAPGDWNPQAGAATWENEEATSQPPSFSSGQGGAHEKDLAETIDVNEMGILPRLVRVLLDRCGETVEIPLDKRIKSRMEGQKVRGLPRVDRSSRACDSEEETNGIKTTQLKNMISIFSTTVKSEELVGSPPNTPKNGRDDPLEEGSRGRSESEGSVQLTLRDLTLFGLEIYMDEISDLFDPFKSTLPSNIIDSGSLEMICEDLNAHARKGGGEYPTSDSKTASRNLSHECSPTKPNASCGGGVQISSVDDLRKAYRIACRNRVVSSHAKNDTSSRSHAIFILQLGLEARNSFNSSGTRLSSYVAMVDLAGSERVKSSGVEGEALREALYINKSLSALSSVVLALSKKGRHVPYRDSKLTQLLRPCLEGGKVLTMIHISPCSSDEALCTLQFAEHIRHARVRSHALQKTTKSSLVLQGLFADLTDPEQEELYEGHRQIQKEYQQLCAEIRIAYLTRSEPANFPYTLTTEGHLDSPEASSSPNDPRSQKHTDVVQAPFLSGPGFEDSVLPHQRAAKLRVLIERHMQHAQIAEEEKFRRELENIHIERDRKVEEARQKRQRDLDNMVAAVEELERLNAKLGEENASPFPRDPYSLEMSKQIKDTTDELHECAKKKFTLSAGIAALRQRLGIQSELERQVDKEIEETLALCQTTGSRLAMTAFLTEGADSNGCTPCEMVTTTTCSEDKSDVAGPSRELIRPIDDPELREIGLQQLFLGEELEALRAETYSFELGDGIWEGLWARSMRQELLTAMKTEIGMMEDILLDPEALEWFAQPLVSYMSSLPWNFPYQGNWRGNKYTQLRDEIEWSGPRSDEYTEEETSLRNRIETYVHAVSGINSAVEKGVYLFSPIEDAPSNIANAMRRQQDSKQKTSGDAGPSAALAFEREFSHGSFDPVRKEPSFGENSLDTTLNGTVRQLCATEMARTLPNPLEIAFYQSSIGLVNTEESKQTPLRPTYDSGGGCTPPRNIPNSRASMLYSPPQGDTRDAEDTRGCSKELLNCTNTVASTSLVGCYDDEEKLHHASVARMLEEGILCDVWCFGMSFEEVYDQYLWSSQEKPKGSKNDTQEEEENTTTEMGFEEDDEEEKLDAMDGEEGAKDCSVNSDTSSEGGEVKILHQLKEDLPEHAFSSTGSYQREIESVLNSSRNAKGCNSAFSMLSKGNPSKDDAKRCNNEGGGCAGGGGAPLLSSASPPSPLPSAAKKWGRLRFAHSQKDRDSYCLELAYMTDGSLPPPPRAISQPSLMTLERTHDPYESLPPALASSLRRLQGANSSTGTTAQAKEKRFMSIPLSEPQLRLDLHLLEDGTRKTAPQWNASGTSLGRTRDKTAMIAIEVSGIPPVPDVAISKANKLSKFINANGDAASASKGLPSRGRGADSNTNEGTKNTNQNTLLSNTSREVILSKRLGGGEELIFPSTAILPNKGICTILIQFSSLSTSVFTRTENIESIVCALCAVMQPTSSNASFPPTPVNHTNALSSQDAVLRKARRSLALFQQQGRTSRPSDALGVGFSGSFASSATPIPKRTGITVKTYHFLPYVLLEPRPYTERGTTREPSEASATNSTRTAFESNCGGRSSSKCTRPSLQLEPFARSTLRGSSLQVHLYFPSTSHSTSAEERTEDDRFIRLAAATLQQLRCVTIPAIAGHDIQSVFPRLTHSVPRSTSNAAISKEPSVALQDRTSSIDREKKIGIRLHQLLMFRKSIRNLVKQQIFDAEDIKGELAYSFSQRELMRGSHIHDIRLEARHTVGLLPTTGPEMDIQAIANGNTSLTIYSNQESAPNGQSNFNNNINNKSSRGASQVEKDTINSYLGEEEAHWISNTDENENARNALGSDSKSGTLVEADRGARDRVPPLAYFESSPTTYFSSTAPSMHHIRSEVSVDQGRELCGFVVPWTIWQWAYRWPAVQRAYLELEHTKEPPPAVAPPTTPQRNRSTCTSVPHTEPDGAQRQEEAVPIVNYDLNMPLPTGPRVQFNNSAASPWSVSHVGPFEDSSSDEELLISFCHGGWAEEMVRSTTEIGAKLVLLPTLNFTEVPSFLGNLST